MTPYRSTSRSGGGVGSGSPFSPSASPLLHKAVAINNNREALEVDRRRSIGSPGLGLGRSQSLRERGIRGGGASDANSPSSPTATGLSSAKRKPGVNYKWMYDRGVRLPRSESIQF